MNDDLHGHPGIMRGSPPEEADQVTIRNMQTPAHSHWAHRYMRRLVPSANVWRGEGPVMPLPSAATEIGEIKFAGAAERELSIGQLVDEGYTDGMVVLHRGRLVYEHYAHDVDPHEPHTLMSVTKSVASAVIGILIERGALSPDDLLTDLIPEVKGSAYEGACLRHLLDMTIGLDYNEDYADPESDIAKFSVALGWDVPREGVPDNTRDYIVTMRPEGGHGERMHYVSTNTHLLGWIVERVSGSDFATLLSHEIWQPMGAEFDAYLLLDRLGAPQTGGGLSVTTRDLARFGQLHLDDGVANARQIVPRGWIEDFRENGDPQLWDRGSFAELLPRCHYRSKWYTDREDPHRAYFGFGVHGQFLYVDPTARVVIAKHSSHPVAVDPAFVGDHRLGFRAIAHALGEG